MWLRVLSSFTLLLTTVELVLSIPIQELAIFERHIVDTQLFFTKAFVTIREANVNGVARNTFYSVVVNSWYGAGACLLSVNNKFP